MPGAEGAAGAAEHHHPHGVVVCTGVEHGAQLQAQTRVDRIEHVRTIEGQDRDRSPILAQHPLSDLHSAAVDGSRKCECEQSKAHYLPKVHVQSELPGEAHTTVHLDPDLDRASRAVERQLEGGF